jgi:hypothetical protein
MSKWLLVVLANCADEDGSTIAGHAHLAALMEATPRTVLANMKLLEAEGFILRMRRNNVHGHRTSDRIQLLMPGRIAGHPTAQTKLKEPHLSVVQGALRGVAKVNDDASLGEAPSPYPITDPVTYPEARACHGARLGEREAELPPEIRAAVVQATDEGFAARNLDGSEWNARTRRLTPKSDASSQLLLSKEVGPLLRKLGVTVLRRSPPGR